jgi:hypothetical protein
MAASSQISNPGGCED